MKKDSATLMTPAPAVPAGKQDAQDSQNPQGAPKLNVGRELLDTTWRMTVPVLIFAVVGIFADRAAGSRPWLTLLGAAFGFLVAAMLVKRQILNGPAPTDKPAPPHVLEAFDKEDDK